RSPSSSRSPGRDGPSACLLDRDGPFRAVGDGQAGLLLLAGRDGAVADLPAVAEIIGGEHLGGGGVAAAVPFAAVLVDVDSHHARTSSTGTVRTLSTSRLMSAVHSPSSAAGRPRAPTTREPTATISANRTTAS